MNSENFNRKSGQEGKSLRKLRILVAPLDWGLGHATRCIPIINELLAAGCDVWLAGEGNQESLLRTEFPSLSFLSLPGYRIRYGRSARGLPWQMLMQYGKIMRTIREEREWLREAREKYAFDAVISDNRYGLVHPAIPSIFITHQLEIRSPFGSWSERLIQKKSYQFLNRFSECWVPDEPGEGNLAGSLSHPRRPPGIPLRYLGLLSRFSAGKDKPAPEPGRLLILLSGPEPQRTILEDRIIGDIAHYPGSATIVRGLPQSLNMIPSSNQIRFYNHLAAAELCPEIEKAELVIGRSGYSSIMDLVMLGKRALFIPTPGQTEQQYLADYLEERGIACHVDQSTFTLKLALERARAFPYQAACHGINDRLREAIISFIQVVEGK